MKRWAAVPVGWVLVALASGLGAAAEPPAVIPWGTDVHAALAEASRAGKPVLVDVWAVWCKPCKEMDETTYRDPGVVRAATGLVPVKVDADVQETFVERYRVGAFPTVLVLDGEGHEVARFEGLVDAPSMKRELQAVLSGYPAYLDASSRSDDPHSLEAAANYLVEVRGYVQAVDLLRKALELSEDATSERREGLELRLAEAQLAADEPRAAADRFERIAREAKAPGIRGRALEGLVRAQRARGRKADAARALEQLRREFPDLAAAFDATAGG